MATRHMHLLQQLLPRIGLDVHTFCGRGGGRVHGLGLACFLVVASERGRSHLRLLAGLHHVWSQRGAAGPLIAGVRGVSQPASPTGSGFRNIRCSAKVGGMSRVVVVQTYKGGTHPGTHLLAPRPAAPLDPRVQHAFRVSELGNCGHSRVHVLRVEGRVPRPEFPP